MYTSLVCFSLDRVPPNITAVFSFIFVSAKSAQGGGLVPVTVGEDHVPEGIGGSKSQMIKDCAIL